MWMWTGVDVDVREGVDAECGPLGHAMEILLYYMYYICIIYVFCMCVLKWMWMRATGDVDACEGGCVRPKDA